MLTKEIIQEIVQELIKKLKLDYTFILFHMQDDYASLDFYHDKLKCNFEVILRLNNNSVDILTYSFIYPKVEKIAKYNIKIHNLEIINDVYNKYLKEKKEVL